MFEWYSSALEVLNPLRFYLNDLIEACESHNRFMRRVDNPIIIPEAKINAAKDALNAAELFLTTAHKSKQHEGD